MANNRRYDITTKIVQNYRTVVLLGAWFKLKTGEQLTLNDIPEIIPYRWEYFRDNWGQIRLVYDLLIDSYIDPNLLRTQLYKLDDFITTQRELNININPFESENNQLRFSAIFDATSINAIPLSVDERNIVNDRTRYISSLGKSEFQQIRKDLIDQRDAVADYIGKSDDTYNSIAGRSSAAAQVSENKTYMEQMSAINQAIAMVEYVLANNFSVSASQGIDPFALARSNANNAEINIGQYASGNLVKLNYGETLQQLATRTLGNSDSWIDIAIANGLKPPYIDEVGEAVYLIANGGGNTVNLPESDITGHPMSDKLYINQIVILQSDAQPIPEQRLIINIKQAPVSGEIVLELDGDSDLNKYKSSENAFVRIFKPGTTNSSFLILIPSNNPIPNQNVTPWFLQKSPIAERNQKVDLLLSDKGDIIFGSGGDLSLSYALQNATQALRLKVSTIAGELVRHPNFGVPEVPGRTYNQSAEIINNLRTKLVSSITSDPRFNSVDTINIQISGPNTISVNIVARIAGSDQVIPISYTIST